MDPSWIRNCANDAALRQDVVWCKEAGLYAWRQRRQSNYWHSSVMWSMCWSFAEGHVLDHAALLCSCMLSLWHNIKPTLFIFSVHECKYAFGLQSASKQKLMTACFYFSAGLGSIVVTIIENWSDQTRNKSSNNNQHSSSSSEKQPHRSTVKEAYHDPYLCSFSGRAPKYQERWRLRLTHRTFLQETRVCWSFCVLTTKIVIWCQPPGSPAPWSFRVCSPIRQRPSFKLWLLISLKHQFGMLVKLAIINMQHSDFHKEACWLTVHILRHIMNFRTVVRRQQLVRFRNTSCFVLKLLSVAQLTVCNICHTFYTSYLTSTTTSYYSLPY